MERRTEFVIDRRLSAARNAVAIMVLEHGRMAERDGCEALLEQKSEYCQPHRGIFELSGKRKGTGDSQKLPPVPSFCVCGVKRGRIAQMVGDHSIPSLKKEPAHTARASFTISRW